MASLAFGVDDAERPYHPNTTAPVLPDFGDVKSNSSLPVSSPTRGGSGTASVNVSADFSSWKYDAYAEGESAALGSAQKLVNKLIVTYTSLLFAQPFEAAKVVLQVRSAEDVSVEEGGRILGTPSQTYGDRTSRYTHDSDSDGEPEYFTSNVSPGMASTPQRQNLPRRQRTRSPRSSKAPAQQLVITNPDSIPEVISQHWQKEGAGGTWKATNASFMYKVIASLMENWSRGVLAAIFNVPDLIAEEDMLDAFSRTEHPWTALGVAAGAAVVTGLVLAPLDLVRTKLLLTPSNRGSRGFWANVRALPSYLCPTTLVLPTALHSVIHPLLTVSLPLTLQSQFKVDWRLSPMTFSVAKFCAASAALFVKLPLETVLRRAQMAVLSSRRVLGSSSEPSLMPVVPLGAYKGVFGTIYHISVREGSRPAPGGSSKKRIGGQGIAGLTRGWTVNFVGLVGLWTTGIISNGGEDDVF